MVELLGRSDGQQRTVEGTERRNVTAGFPSPEALQEVCGEMELKAVWMELQPVFEIRA